MNLVKPVVLSFGLFLMVASCVGFIEGVSDGPRRPDRVWVEDDTRLPSGDYVQSCNDCRVSFGELKCWCKDRRGFNKSTSISLSFCRNQINNEDGRLVCGRTAPVPPTPPRYVPAPLPFGNYKDSCSSCNMNGSVLSCSCTNTNGNSRSTSLETRYCNVGISNDDGRLVCGQVVPKRPAPLPLPFGSYKDSCSSCDMNGSVLSCSCTNTNGNSRSTSLETRYCNVGVSNDDGRLVCGQVAPKPAPRPMAKPHGSYQESCRNCEVNDNRMSCECQDTNSIYRPTTIWLPCHKVENCNGQLKCGNC